MAPKEFDTRPDAKKMIVQQLFAGLTVYSSIPIESFADSYHTLGINSQSINGSNDIIVEPNIVTKMNEHFNEESTSSC